MHYNRSYFLSKQLSIQACLSHVLLTCSVYLEKSGYKRQPATASQTVLTSLHENAHFPHSSSRVVVLLSLLNISPFRTPQILSSVAGSGLKAESTWTFFWWCIQFLASSSSYLWLLIPTPTASFQLCQHKHLCSRAGDQIGELIQLKITFFFPSQCSGRVIPNVAG